MTPKYNIISSHSQFQPLKEVMLGGVYPDSFFDHLDNKTQDVMCSMNEHTNNDLNKIKSHLNKFNIGVVEPEFTTLDDFLDGKDNLIRPPITPCDYYFTLNDTLYIIPQYDSGVDPFQHAINKWKQNNQKVVVLDREKPDPMVWCSFASMIRIGNDIIIDIDSGDPTRKKHCINYITELSKLYRVHVSQTGDHLDSVFCVVKPGVLLASPYYNNNWNFFKDWNIVNLPDRTEINKSLLPDKAKWWLPGVDYMHYNQHVLSVAKKWLGHPVETIFSVNNLVIDENNIIMHHCEDDTAKQLEDLGINVHVVELKTRLFWDAGLHCLSRDIYREGNLIDYYPDSHLKNLNWLE